MGAGKRHVQTRGVNSEETAYQTDTVFAVCSTKEVICHIFGDSLSFLSFSRTVLLRAGHLGGRSERARHRSVDAGDPRIGRARRHLRRERRTACGEYARLYGVRPRQRRGRCGGERADALRRAFSAVRRDFKKAHGRKPFGNRHCKAHGQIFCGANRRA